MSLDSLVRDYGDPFEEALCCRRDCALFDFSFVYRARVSGRDAVRRIEQFQPRNVRDMAVGQIRYSVKTDQRMRVRSDLTLWRCAPDRFEIMSGLQEDILELLALAGPGFQVEDLSAATAILALQGPNSLDRLGPYLDSAALRRLPYFAFVDARIAGMRCVIARLGYSGEQGFEILLEQSCKQQLWDMLTEQVRPAGFAAIDVLRIEAGFFLFSNECRIAPSMADLGLSSLLKSGIDSASLRFTGFRAESDSRPVLWQPRTRRVAEPPDGAIAVTSACYSPLYEGVIGLGFVALDNCREEARSAADADFRQITLCALPFYDPGKRIPRSPWK